SSSCFKTLRVRSAGRGGQIDSCHGSPKSAESAGSGVLPLGVGHKGGSAQGGNWRPRATVAGWAAMPKGAANWAGGGLALSVLPGLAALAGLAPETDSRYPIE